MKYLTRKEAAAYLRKHGLACGHLRLSHLAMTGEGPQFRYWGRFPIYTEDDLDAWIRARLDGAPTRTTRPRRRREQPTSDLSPPT